MLLFLNPPNPNLSITYRPTWNKIISPPRVLSFIKYSLETYGISWKQSIVNHSSVTSLSCLLQVPNLGIWYIRFGVSLKMTDAIETFSVLYLKLNRKM